MPSGPANAPLPDAWRPEGSQGTTSSPERTPRHGYDLLTDFVGRKRSMFWLALKTMVMTVLTLGIYRFWMKTRMRRYMWSSVRPGGTALEYVGDPFEKLLGFLVAVVFLAFYIGLVNLLLVFGSFAIFQVNAWGYVVSFVGVIPFIFFAQYRARRYVLARTRWRGIRFGLEPGAWGYAWRAGVHWLITICTAGILWPRMTFWLEKYRVDRTFFGQQRMHQGGKWTMLWPKIWRFYVGAIFMGVGVALVVAEIGSAGPIAVIGLGLLWMLYGYAYYRAESFKLLAAHKSAGEIKFRANPGPWRVARIYLFGNLITYFVFVFLIAAAIFAVAIMDDSLIAQMLGLTVAPNDVPKWIILTVSIVAYFSSLILLGAMAQTFVTLPLVRHFTETLVIVGAPHLAEVQQRERDEASQAEGFAEALDVGAAL